VDQTDVQRPRETLGSHWCLLSNTMDRYVQRQRCVLSLPCLQQLVLLIEFGFTYSTCQLLPNMGRFTDVLKSQLCSEKSKRNATTADSVGPTLILSIILRKALDRLNITTSGLEMCRGGGKSSIHTYKYIQALFYFSNPEHT